MAQTSITLTASMRSNLSSLKSIQKQMDVTQERLSTGKKVNSAIDNPSSFYQARSLTNRAGDLDALLDSMGQGIQTIQAANEGIEAVTAFVEQLKSIATSAYSLDPSLESYESSIQSYKEQYAEILTEIENLVKDSSYQGVNLLTGGDLTITFNESRSNRFEINGDDVVAEMDLTTSGNWSLEYPKINKLSGDIEVDGETYTKQKLYSVQTDDAGATEEAIMVSGKYYMADGSEVTAFAGTTPTEIMVDDTNAQQSYATSIDATLDKLSEAVDYLRSYATELGNNYSIIETRQNFTDAMIDVLETGADNLVLADMNEESANYLALQTRQQLAVNSLSLASQSAQSVLSLF